jgi:hypothetical protein
MSYACPAWEFAADACKTGGTPVRELHVALPEPYIYDHVTKLCRRQAEVVQNHENANVRDIEKGEARHRKYKRFKLDGGQAYDSSND